MVRVVRYSGVKLLVAFIDESGKPTKKEKTPFVVSALIIEDDDIVRIRREIHDLKTCIISNIDPQAEIHAKDIVHGKRYYRSVRMEDRKRLFDALCNYIASLNCTIISVVIVKKSVLESRESDRVIREEIEKRAYSLLLERLVIYLNKRGKGNEVMLLVIDETDVGHDKSIKEKILEEISKGIYTSRYPSSRRVFKIPLFYPSIEMTPLQLADIVAYTIFKKYSKPRSAVFDFNNYFNIIKEKFDRCASGRILGCGLKVFTV